MSYAEAQKGMKKLNGYTKYAGVMMLDISRSDLVTCYSHLTYKRLSIGRAAKITIVILTFLFQHLIFCGL